MIYELWKVLSRWKADDLVTPGVENEQGKKPLRKKKKNPNDYKVEAI